MKISVARFGMFILLLMIPISVLAAGQTFYSRIRGFTEFSEILNGADLAVMRYIPKIFPEASPDISKADVDSALFLQLFNLCGGKLEFGECATVSSDVHKFTIRIEFIRTLGRDLQLIASGYERMVNEHSIPSSLILKVFSVLKFWQSDTDSYLSPFKNIRMRSVFFPKEKEEEVQAAYGGVQGALAALIDRESGKEYRDEFIAAVWRYQYGFREVQELEGESCEAFVNPELNKEAHNLFERWCGVEDALEKVWDLVVETEFDPPLQAGDIFMPHLIEDLGVIVWIRIDGIKDEELFGDVGLTWEFALEPVYPTLITKDGVVVLGGEYPDPPKIPAPRTKLCKQLLASFGYLCKPVEATKCPVPEEDEEDDTDDDEESGTGVVLTNCKPLNLSGSGAWRTMESGPNICGIGGWRTAPEEEDEDESAEDEDEDLMPDECSNCGVKFSSGEDCGSGGGGGGGGDEDNPSGAAGIFKDDDRMIGICIDETEIIEGGEIPAEYALIHSLVHAQQLCNLPPHTGLYSPTKWIEAEIEEEDVDADADIDVDVDADVDVEIEAELEIAATQEEYQKACCSKETEAYMVMCNAIAEDGNFDDTDITIEECASVLADKTCTDAIKQNMEEGEEIEMPTSFCLKVPYPLFADDPDKKNLFERIIEAANQSEEGPSIEDLIEEEDLPPRVQAIKDSMALVCSPTCKTQYRNSIGNNACFLGQCIEQSIEYARIIPGRMAFVTQDAAYAWDADVEIQDDNGAFLSVPAISDTVIPAYRPALFMQHMDKAFCQANGLPLFSPPDRCVFDTRRRLQLALNEFSPMAEAFINQPAQQDTSAENTQEMLQSAGARIGTRLFVNYFHTKVRQFAQLVRVANSLFKDITETEFPDSMCKRYNGPDE